METACILCNSMETLALQCNCGAIMQDTGPVTDYSGAYSPYYNLSFENNYCQHLFTCPECGYDRVIAIPLVTP